MNYEVCSSHSPKAQICLNKILNEITNAAYFRTIHNLLLTLFPQIFVFNMIWWDTEWEGERKEFDDLYISTSFKDHFFPEIIINDDFVSFAILSQLHSTWIWEKAGSKPLMTFRSLIWCQPDMKRIHMSDQAINSTFSLKRLVLYASFNANSIFFSQASSFSFATYLH